MRTRKLFLARHAKSSAFAAALAIHGLLAIAAIFLIVSTAQRPNEVFLEPRRFKRPSMPEKIVKISTDTRRRPPAPRLRTPIVSERTPLAAIAIPTIRGVPVGLGNMGGIEGNWSPGLNTKLKLIGTDTPQGNELVGTFFDLKQTPDRQPTKIAELFDGGHQHEAHNLYIAEVANFARGWSTGRLRNYFQAPMKKYSACFMIPAMDADIAPQAYGVGSIVKPRHWLAYYTGQFTAPETDYYRFWGHADDVLLVRVRNRLVLDGSHIAWEKRITDWESEDPMNRKFSTPGGAMVIGDWFQLKKGQPVKLEILFGECPGGGFSCELLIEARDATYAMDGERPILPVFKTNPIGPELQREIKLHGMATFEGPSFGSLLNQ